jgi:hypothetical protein
MGGPANSGPVCGLVEQAVGAVGLADAFKALLVGAEGGAAQAVGLVAEPAGSRVDDPANLARLWHTIGDHQLALLLEAAADRAPDAAAVSGIERWPADAPSARHIGRTQASTSTRARVLEVARQSIDHHLRQ